MNSSALEYQIIELERQLGMLYQCRSKLLKKHRHPTEQARWYNIDTGEHHITSQGLRFQSEIFWIESNYGDVFYEYYKSQFGIEHKAEEELFRRLKLINIDDYTLVDPYEKELIILASNVRKYKYRSARFRILSNNKELFEELHEIMKIRSSYIPRKKRDWFNTEIKQYLMFSPPIIDSNNIITIKVDDIEVYYSEHHMLWGFNRKEFDYIYSLEVGHPPDQQKTLIERLKRRPRNIYTNLDPNMTKMDGVSKECTSQFNFVDDNLLIVANSKTIFEAYRKLLN